MTRFPCPEPDKAGSVKDKSASKAKATKDISSAGLENRLRTD